MPTMRLRVVCGFGETMATFCPRMRLSRVDLPALGRPIKATTPYLDCAMVLGDQLSVVGCRELTTDNRQPLRTQSYPPPPTPDRARCARDRCAGGRRARR